MHNTRKMLLRDLHGSLIDIMGAMNRPQGDRAIIDAAGVTLDRALFPLLVLIERRGPIGVVDLADRVGRDYTTVSRQVARLDELGLVERSAGRDRRVREATVTPAGRAMNDAIDKGRDQLASKALHGWSAEELATFVPLLRRFADTLGGAGR